MKKYQFILLFICTNILFFIAHTAKNIMKIKLSYINQKHKKTYQQLTKEIEFLHNKFEILHNNMQIKLYASTQLKLQPINFKKIKKVYLNESTM